MKLKDPDDLIHFLVDIDRLDLLESEDPIDPELFELFLKKRKPLVTKMKNFRKSQRQKQVWREKRFKVLTGIRRFHRSVRGKRMHKAIGRFIATRIFRDEDLKLNDAHEALKAISSIRTHIYIEADYYMPLQEEVEFREFVDYAIPVLGHLEFCLFEDSSYIPLNDELELLLRIVQPDVLQKEVNELLEKEIDLESLKQEVVIKISEDSNDFMLKVFNLIET